MSEEKNLNSQQEGTSSEQQYSLNDDRRVKVLSPGAMVAKRFFRNRVAVFGMIVLVLMFIFSFVGGVISPYEEDEKFNLMNSAPESKSITFQRPAQGVVTSFFDPGKSRYGVDISTLPHSSVSAVYQGVVFNSGYDFNSGYYVEIIHPQNYISLYKQLAGIYVRNGENVKSGQVIGTMYNGDKGTGKHILHFELWNENVAQNPLDYLVIE